MKLAASTMYLKPKSDADPQTPIEFVRALFLEDLDTDINEALKAANARFPGVLTQNVVSEIRQDVRSAVERAQGGGEGTGHVAASAKPRFANHPRIASKPPLPVPATKETPVVKASQKEAKEQTPEDRNRRKRWFTDWAESNYMSTVAEARQALLDHFGIAFGTDYLSKTLRTAKDRQKAMQRGESPGRRFAMPPETNPNIPALRPGDYQQTGIAARESTVPVSVDGVQAEAETIARHLRRIGIQKIELFEDGTFTFSFSAGRIRLD